MESTLHLPLKKSARVVLTVAAAMSMAARGLEALNPCDTSTFNVKACKVAVKHQGYCDGSTWIPTAYSERYPYYYDSYQAYLAGGGLATPAEVGNCQRGYYGVYRAHGVSHVSQGGFGAIGAGHHHHGG